MDKIGGDRMNISDTIIQLAKDNNGVITSAAITEKGIFRGNLKKTCG